MMGGDDAIAQNPMIANSSDDFLSINGANVSPLQPTCYYLSGFPGL